VTPEEFSALYREYLPQISKYLIRRCDRSDVEELASRIFEIAWNKKDQAEIGFELPWLYKIAGYVIANHRRSLNTRANFLAAFTSPDISPSTEDIAIADLAIAEAWSKLTPADRQVLALVSFDGLNNQQAAKVLEISPNAVAIRVNRARGRLAEYLSEES
jgi:RNA polymerase sigma-70 factor, ECF subfamily